MKVISTALLADKTAGTERGERTTEVPFKKYLLAGELFATSAPHEIITVLGSCVAVCLWDPVLRVGGMNHFMLPDYHGNSKPSSRYGTVAIPRLLARMDSLGSKRHNIRANISGGGNVLRSNFSEEELVGMKNILIAREILKAEGIPIVSEDAGNMYGRKIRFNTLDGTIMVEVVNSICHNREVKGP